MKHRFKTVRIFFFSFICCLTLHVQSVGASSSDALKRLLEKTVAGVDHKMKVGVAVILNGQDTVVVNNDFHYPLMSVYKFHQALAVTHTLEQQGVSLDTLLSVAADEIHEDTYSPLRDKYGTRDLSLSVRQLLEYTLLWSDNNACDILFDHIVGPVATDAYLRSRGMKDFSIAATEYQMHENPTCCRENWSTPLSGVEALEKMLGGQFVHGEYRSFLIETMKHCTTGRNRLPCFTGASTVVWGHKTGTGGRDTSGVLMAVNDMGFFILPDGQRYSIAVFIADSQENLEKTEKVIADLSELVYRHVLRSSE